MQEKLSAKTKLGDIAKHPHPAFSHLLLEGEMEINSIGHVAQSRPTPFFGSVAQLVRALH